MILIFTCNICQVKCLDLYQDAIAGLQQNEEGSLSALLPNNALLFCINLSRICMCYQPKENKPAYFLHKLFPIQHDVIPQIHIKSESLNKLIQIIFERQTSCEAINEGSEDYKKASGSSSYKVFFYLYFFAFEILGPKTGI